MYAVNVRARVRALYMYRYVLAAVSELRFIMPRVASMVKIYSVDKHSKSQTGDISRKYGM